MKPETTDHTNHSEIPVIDIGPFLNGAPQAAEETADRLRWVQEEIGFYYLINHGISANLIQNALEQVKLFHNLPIEKKLDLKVDDKSTGYVPIRSTVYVSSNVNKNTKKDLNANFRMSVSGQSISRQSRQAAGSLDPTNGPTLQFCLISRM